jgi:hypothetical protein
VAVRGGIGVDMVIPGSGVLFGGQLIHIRTRSKRSRNMLGLSRF